MDALTVPAILSAGMSALAGTVVFLFLRLEKAKADYLADLKAEHAKRLEDKDKAAQALFAQTERMHTQLDRMADLVETMTGKKIPP